MSISIVLTVVSDDKPGIVEALSEAIRTTAVTGQKAV